MRPIATALAGTGQRLRSLRPEYPDAYAVEFGQPEGPGWLRLEGADDAVVVWCAAARERENPRRLASVAATAVGGALAHAVLGRVTAALLLDRRAWDVSAGNLAVAGDGARVAVLDASCLLLPADPAAGEPGTTVVADLPALLDLVARRAVATLDPLFDAVRAATRYGIVPLWNGAADAVRSAATFVPLYAGGDRAAGRDLGVALVDALVAHGARIRNRGDQEWMRWRDGSYPIPVRAACCLYYKTEPPVDRPGDEYCITCPFLAGDARQRRFGSFLDELSAAGCIG